MRIVSGIYKGKRLFAPKNLPVRPTTDFAKEGLFNVLHHSLDFDALTVLDLFCGTGNISYEFLSRGVQHVTSIDQSFSCIKYVKKVVKEELNALNHIAFCCEAVKYVQKTTQQYSLIFADPPYQFEGYDALVLSIFKQNIVAKDGLVIMEHSKQADLSHLPHYRETKKYGNVQFSFFSVEAVS